LKKERARMPIGEGKLNKREGNGRRRKATVEYRRN